MLEIINLSLLAAIIGLDVTAFGQFMISQPIVCGPLFGFLLGDLKTGLWIGMMIEMQWVKLIPMGAAIPHNVTAICILSLYWGLRSGFNSNGVFMLSLALAVIVAMAFKTIDIRTRYINPKIIHWVESSIKNGNEDALSQGIGLGVFLFFLRSFLFYLIMMKPGLMLITYTYPKLPLFVVEGLNLCWWLIPAAGLGILLLSFHSRFFNVGKNRL